MLTNSGDAFQGRPHCPALGGAFYIHHLLLPETSEMTEVLLSPPPPGVTDKEAEAQSSRVLCSRSHGKQWVRLGLD